MLIETSFSFTGTYALKHRNKTNIKQVQLQGELYPNVLFRCPVDGPVTRGAFKR